MVAKKSQSRLGKERLGLMMIAASLIGIAVITFLILEFQNSTRVADIRSDGVSLVGLLSRFSYTDLVHDDSSANVLEALVYSGDKEGLLYTAVVDTAGRVAAEASKSGVFAPPFRAAGVGSFSGEQHLTIAEQDLEVLEFYGPLMRQNDLAGYIRIGYRLPSGISMSQLPFLATLALTVFLITTLIYVLVRREIKPINQLNNQMSHLVENGNLQNVSISASGEMGEFMQRFNAFVDLAQNKIHKLEDQESRLVSAKNLISYRRSRVERVVESLPFGILVLDENGAVTFTNSMLSKMLGVDTKTIRDSDHSVWSPSPQLTGYLDEVRKRCRGNFVLEPMEMPSPNSAGKTLEVGARQVLEGGGAIVIVIDVTREVLARQGRGEFIAHISHELKTPLNTLALYSEALQGEDGADKSFRLEATNIISDEVERLASLINNLLSITKIEMGSLSLSRSLVKPRDLLADLFTTAQRSCRRTDLEFDLQLPAEMNPIHADKEMLRVAINNLLTNAIKYNQPGGKVTLAVQESDDSLII
ncbi:MAG: PAS domain-containing protein, partial [Gammaproteobacteria bacterium]|nr:PAS domain-containing protein [Gammaproteobacteria bacterium]